MNWERPSPAEVWKAIDIYLKTAYGREPPAAVRARLETLRSVPETDFYESGVFEREAGSDPSRFSLRLGNRFYPHMKLVIERAPNGNRYLYRADTHDRHACPEPTSREYGAYLQLVEMNRDIAQAVEAAWDSERLPTFKSYLRQDLARRAVEGG